MFRIKEMSITNNPNQCKAKILKVRTYISICLTVFAVVPFVSDTAYVNTKTLFYVGLDQLICSISR